MASASNKLPKTTRDVDAQKQAARRSARARRRAAAASSPPDAPRAAARRLMERPPRPLACRVAGYWPAKSEFDA
ncbi:MAG: hypothetical protein AAF527_11825, partial [Pseudomonadota bacterium]